MIPEKYIELMNKEIDGINSAAESGDLNVHLAAHPEASEFFDKLKGVAVALDQVHEVEPPSDLKRLIMSSLPRREVPRGARPVFLGSIRSMFSAQPGLGYALCFLAGIGIGILALIALRNTEGKSSESDDLYGTLMQNESTANLTPGNSLQINVGDISGTATLKSSPRYAVAELRISSSRSVDVILEYKGDEVKMSGVGAKGGLKDNVIVNSNSVQVTHKGTETYVFAFNGTAQSGRSINLKLMAEGNVLYEHSLSAEDSGR